MTVPGLRPLGYTGLKETNPPQLFFRPRDPDTVTYKDFRGYDIGDEWQNTQTGEWFKMISKRVVSVGGVLVTQGIWASITGTSAFGPIETINSIAPDGASNFGVIADPGIVINPGVNSISVGASVDNVTIGFDGSNQLTVLGSSAFIWNEIAVNTAAVVNNGYVCNAGAPLTVTLPAVFAFGDVIEVTDKSLNGFSVQAAGGDIIVWNGVTSSAGGGWTSLTPGSTLRLLAVTANSRWDVINGNGNLISF